MSECHQFLASLLDLLVQICSPKKCVLIVSRTGRNWSEGCLFRLLHGQVWTPTFRYLSLAEGAQGLEKDGYVRPDHLTPTPSSSRHCCNYVHVPLLVTKRYDIYVMIVPSVHTYFSLVPKCMMPSFEEPSCHSKHVKCAFTLPGCPKAWIKKEPDKPPVLVLIFFSLGSVHYDLGGRSKSSKTPRPRLKSPSNFSSPTP